MKFKSICIAKQLNACLISFLLYLSAFYSGLFDASFDCQSMEMNQFGSVLYFYSLIDFIGDWCPLLIIACHHSYINIYTFDNFNI